MVGTDFETYFCIAIRASPQLLASPDSARTWAGQEPEF